MTRAVTALLLAGLPLCIAVQAAQVCQCDNCGKRSTGMAQGSISAFNRFGMPVLHYCPTCTKEAPLLLSLYGLNARYLKNSKSQKLISLASLEPESKVLKRLDQQSQMQKPRELGHGFPWQGQRRYS